MPQCVTVEQVPLQVDQESVEIDDFLDNSMAGSSFLFFSGEVCTHPFISHSTAQSKEGQLQSDLSFVLLF